MHAPRGMDPNRYHYIDQAITEWKRTLGRKRWGEMAGHECSGRACEVEQVLFRIIGRPQGDGPRLHHHLCLARQCTCPHRPPDTEVYSEKDLYICVRGAKPHLCGETCDAAVWRRAEGRFVCRITGHVLPHLHGEFRHFHERVMPLLPPLVSANDDETVGGAAADTFVGYWQCAQWMVWKCLFSPQRSDQIRTHHRRKIHECVEMCVMYIDATCKRRKVVGWQNVMTIVYGKARECYGRDASVAMTPAQRTQMIRYYARQCVVFYWLFHTHTSVGRVHQGTLAAFPEFCLSTLYILRTGITLVAGSTALLDHVLDPDPFLSRYLPETGQLTALELQSPVQLTQRLFGILRDEHARGKLNPHDFSPSNHTQELAALERASCFVPIPKQVLRPVREWIRLTREAPPDTAGVGLNSQNGSA